jgi:hypothetical protein
VEEAKREQLPVSPNRILTQILHNKRKNGLILEDKIVIAIFVNNKFAWHYS